MLDLSVAAGVPYIVCVVVAEVFALQHKVALMFDSFHLDIALENTHHQPRNTHAQNTRGSL